MFIANLRSIFFALLFTFTFSYTALAQEIEEVVVTATKKEESTQDIAVSITAITADLLAAEQIYDLSDLAEVVPGFETAKGVGSGSGFVMRGIGSYGVGAAVVSSIVTSINGHSVNTSVMTDLGFIDLERIEILNGPQGTLFGRNSVQGVINLITKRPTEELGGYVDVEVGSFDKQFVKGAINVPFSDSLRTRLAFATNTRDGMVENGYTGNAMDDRNDQSIRLSVDWDINDTTELKFTYSGQKSDDNRPQEEASYCQPDQFFGCSPYERGPLGGSPDSRGSAFGLFGFIGLIYPGTVSNDFGTALRADSFDTLYFDREPTHLQEIEVSNLELVKELDNNLTLVAKYSYETRLFQQMNDNDGVVNNQPMIGAGAGAPFNLPPIVADVCFGTTNFGFCETVDTNKVYDFSDVFTNSGQGEINIVSDYDGSFNFTLGYYIFDERNDNEYRVQSVGSQLIGDFGIHPYLPIVNGVFNNDFSNKGGVGFYQTLAGALAFAPAALQAQGLLAAGMTPSAAQMQALQSFGAFAAALNALPDATVPFDMRGTLSDQHVRTKSQALYGEAYFDLNDTTKLTLGLRYDDLSTAASTYNGGLLSGGWLLAGGPAYENRRDVPGLVEYRVIEDSATNGKIAIQKYLQEDIMVYASYSTATKGGGVNAGNNPTPYDKEETSVIDFGLKAKLLDGAMLLNMNIYANENNGMLLDTIRDTQSFNINVDAEITGFEGLMKVFLSETTQLDFSWLMVDAEITSDTSAVNYLNPANAELVQYLGPVDPFGSGFLTGAVFSNGETWIKSGGFNCSTAQGFNPAGNVNCPASVGNPVSLQGLPLPRVADLSYSIAFTQLFPTDNGVTSARLAYRFRDESNGDPYNMSRFAIPENKTFDFLLRYTPNNGDWYVGAYAKNLADDQYMNSIRSGSNAQGGQLYASFTDPRSWGIQFGSSF
jgi:outer membrane receptor protein involved in Fe transport